MSATLGGGLAERVASTMGLAASEGREDGAQGVPVIVSEGRSFPVGEERRRNFATSFTQILIFLSVQIMCLLIP